MSETIIIYECGLRIGNKYCKFMQSKDEKKVDEYIEIMKVSCEKGEIVKYIKHFDCTSVIIARGNS